MPVDPMRATAQSAAQTSRLMKTRSQMVWKPGCHGSSRPRGLCTGRPTLQDRMLPKLLKVSRKARLSMPLSRFLMKMLPRLVRRAEGSLQQGFMSTPTG